MSKIVFVNRFFYPDHSATSQMLSDLAFSLADKGMQVEVVSSSKSYQERGQQQSSRDIVNGVVVHRLWAPPIRGRGLVSRAAEYSVFYILSSLKLLSVVRKGDVVVAMTDPPLMNILVWIVASMKRGEVVNWLQDIFPEVAAELGFTAAKGIVGSGLLRIRDFVLRHSHATVVIGDRMRERLRIRGIPDSQMHVISNWADGISTNPDPSLVSNLRQSWVGEGKFVVGYSGNLGRAHTFESVFEAAKCLASDPDIVFLWVGGGVNYEVLRRRVKASGLNNFVFKPYQSRERLTVALRVPDVHLMSLNPRLEGLIVPSKFYGIAAAGKASIFLGDPQGEIGRLIVENKCGIAIRDNDPDTLVESILHLKSNLDQVKRMGVRAQNLYLERFTREVSTAHWYNVLCSGTHLEG